MRSRRAASAAGLAALLLTMPAAARAAGQELSTGLQVRITAPANGEYIFGKTRIAAVVKTKIDTPGIRVEFSVAGKLIFIDKEPPFECFHDFGDASRSWVIEAKAITPDGETATSTIVTRRLEIHYREEVDRVLVTVSVTDKDHQFIEGLSREDFRVSEDGEPQQIADFGVENRPITLGVLIDTSGSMKEEIKDVQTAAKDFVDTLRPEDSAFVVDFDENVFLLQDITHDHKALQTAIEGTDADGGTALYDALYVSFRKMRDIDGRKAIVVLTDGEDTNSSFSYKRVLELTRTHDVIIYAIGLGTSVLERGLRSTLSELSEDSGGRAFFPHDVKDLEGVYDQVAADLRSQYFLTYSPTNKAFDGSWRKIKLECDRSDAELTTRRGYYAVKH